jgi:hypothetical protein
VPEEERRSVRHEPIAQRATCAGPLAGRYEYLERASGLAQRACATSHSRQCRPSRSRLIYRVVRHAPAPEHVARGSRRWDRGLAFLAVWRRVQGVLTSRCTGQAQQCDHASGWRALLGSTIITLGQPALAGELCVRAARRRTATDLLMGSSCEESARSRAAKRAQHRVATSPLRDKPAAPARWLDGTSTASSASGFSQRASSTSRCRAAGQRDRD